MAPKKKNGFYFFMLEVQRREEEKGVRCTLAAAQALADPLWKRLSAEEKQNYNEKAKIQNGIDKNDLSKKFTSLGVSFATIENEQRQKVETLNVMTANIKSTVEYLKKNNKLAQQPFFVAHVNHFYKTKDNYYAPAELAIVVFSFEQGRIDHLHLFIDVGKIPLGYQSEVKEWSERIHKIPFIGSEWSLGIKDYYDIYLRVVDFIKKHSPKEFPPIYTMVDSLLHNYCHSAVECFFQNICEAASKDSSMFRVYYLDRLFREVLCATRNTDLLSAAIARSEIEKDSFSYTANIACEYHEEVDCSLNCSLSMAIRWVYTICDHCCKDMNIPLVLGFHVPLDVDVNWQQKNKAYLVDPKKLSIKSPKLHFTESRNQGTSQQDSYYYSDTRSVCSQLESTSSGTDAESTDKDADSDWTTVSSKGMGRGRVLPSDRQKVTKMLPTSGRGRLAALK